MGNLSGKGSHPAGSPTMHQVPCADKNGLCSLEARDRNRRETCLFLSAVRGNSCSVESRPIREKQSRPRADFPLRRSNFCFVLFSVPFLLKERYKVASAEGNLWRLKKTAELTLNSHAEMQRA